MANIFCPFWHAKTSIFKKTNRINSNQKFLLLSTIWTIYAWQDSLEEPTFQHLLTCMCVTFCTCSNRLSFKEAMCQWVKNNNKLRPNNFHLGFVFGLDKSFTLNVGIECTKCRTQKLSTRKQVKYRFFNYFNFRLIRNCLCLTKFTFHWNRTKIIFRKDAF